jgi:hypothetical protein
MLVIITMSDSVFAKMKNFDVAILNEIVLPEHIDTMARLPYPIEDRFDLIFLHAALRPLSLIGPADIFNNDQHDYCVSRVNYMNKLFVKKHEDKNNAKLWGPLLAESVGVLSDRPLFKDAEYREKIMRTYTELLKSGYLDMPGI